MYDKHVDTHIVNLRFCGVQHSDQLTSVLDLLIRHDEPGNMLVVLNTSLSYHKGVRAQK